jgi:hypothetical protein
MERPLGAAVTKAFGVESRVVTHVRRTSRPERAPLISLIAIAAVGIARPTTGHAAETVTEKTVAAEAATAVFALVVTNNRSATLDRPDLQYADDDGARYYQLFRGVAPAEHLRLLTRFDRATALVHPELTAEAVPPRRAELAAALAGLHAAVARAHQAGKRTELYFVFAGHGDVEGGIGYLDLEDGRIDATFLEREVVDRVAADVEHIILDSCNSFFVVNPRKPGGRRWATPQDLALGFARRHPNVGLFLSTNSEAEVYEWSELESGIFSHEVRSGLSGAADANGDGRVSYAELAGFVDRANAKLPRANLRPQVFDRGPNGEASAPLFSPGLAAGRRVALGNAERRVWIRGAAAERLIDLHKEEGPMTVVVPGPTDQPLSIVEWQAARTSTERPVMTEYDAPSGGAPVSLDALASNVADNAARGGATMFGELFKAPYGAHAYAAYVGKQAAASEPVFGITAADEARMRHYLTFISQSDREISSSQAIVLGGVGVVFAGTGIASALEPRRWGGSLGGGLFFAGLGLGFLAEGLNLGLSRTAGEAALESFESELISTHGDRGLAVAHIEAHLDDLAHMERRKARFIAGYMGVFAALLAGAATGQAITGGSGREPAHLVALYGSALVTAAVAWRSVEMEMPTERLLRLYRSDPELQLHVGVAPMPGGAGLSLSGGF